MARSGWARRVTVPMSGTPSAITAAPSGRPVEHRAVVGGELARRGEVGGVVGADADEHDVGVGIDQRRAAWPTTSATRAPDTATTCEVDRPPELVGQPAADLARHRLRRRDDEPDARRGGVTDPRDPQRFGRSRRPTVGRVRCGRRRGRVVLGRGCGPRPASTTSAPTRPIDRDHAAGDDAGPR